MTAERLGSATARSIIARRLPLSQGYALRSQRTFGLVVGFGGGYRRAHLGTPFDSLAGRCLTAKNGEGPGVRLRKGAK
jgi:hypothetical protein